MYIVVTEGWHDGRTLYFNICKDEAAARKMVDFIIKCYKEHPQSVFHNFEPYDWKKHENDKQKFVVTQNTLDDESVDVKTYIASTSLPEIAGVFQLCVYYAKVSDLTWSEEMISQMSSLPFYSGNLLLNTDMLKNS